MQAGTTPTQMAAGFLASPEFAAVYSGSTGGDFVNALYQNVLGRPADAGGAQYWTSALASGLSQAGALTAFSDSPENRATTAGATHDGWVYFKG